MNELLMPESLRSPIFDAFCKSVDKQYIYICDVKTDIWRWSPYAVSYFNLPGEQISNLPPLWIEMVHPEDREYVAEVLGDMFSGKSREHSCEYRIKNHSGAYVWVQCRGCMVYDENGDMNICAGVLTDLGQKNKFDDVTGFYSLHEFPSILREALKGSNAKGGILMFGIDNFRRINEAKRYSYGNAVLHEFAARLQKEKPEKASFFRGDGDKFILLWPDADGRDMKNIFTAFQKIAQDGVMIENERIAFTITGGAIRYPEQGNMQDSLHAGVEYALESAKKHNREGLTFYTDRLQKETMKRFRIQQKLRESVRNDFCGFFLCYQPTVTADGGQELVGAEALLRWLHPEFGVVSPVDFIPMLEESGDIMEVGKWVLHTALSQVKKWLVDKPNMKISINVSMLQLRDKSFKNFVLNEVNKIGFPTAQMILELTESCKVTATEEVEEELNFFRENGIQIALDDFGTGYASLSILRELTADWIKVDQSFVAQIAHNNFDQALTETLINLCKKLNLKVCVEGIETEEIETVIREYEPTIMQGYLFSRPLETEMFEKIYIKN